MLLGHFADDRSPPSPHASVPSTPHPAAAYLRYEAVRSPLDMGSEPALVRPGHGWLRTDGGAAVSHQGVPCHRRLRRSLRFGEDVDLIWRLDDAGWMCRYEHGSATHVPRPTCGHGPGSASPDTGVPPPRSIAATRDARPAGSAGWKPAGWTAASGGTGQRRWRRDRRIRPPDTEARRPGSAGVAMPAASATALHAGRQLADATMSVWWPFALRGALSTRRPAGPCRSPWSSPPVSSGSAAGHASTRCATPPCGRPIGRLRRGRVAGSRRRLGPLRPLVVPRIDAVHRSVASAGRVAADGSAAHRRRGGLVGRTSRPSPRRPLGIIPVVKGNGYGFGVGALMPDAGDALPTRSPSAPCTRPCDVPEDRTAMVLTPALDAARWSARRADAHRRLDRSRRRDRPSGLARAGGRQAGQLRCSATARARRARRPC